MCIRDRVTNILNEGGFEVLNNSARTIHYRNSSFRFTPSSSKETPSSFAPLHLNEFKAPK